MSVELLLHRKDIPIMAYDTKPKEQAEAAELQPTFGRYAEIPYDQMTPEQQEGYHELLRSIGGEPGTQLAGPLKIWVNNPKLATAMGPITQHFSPPNDSLSEREHELAVSIINSKWHTPYSINAHVERAEKLGLPANMVEAPAGLSPPPLPHQHKPPLSHILTPLPTTPSLPP